MRTCTWAGVAVRGMGLVTGSARATEVPSGQELLDRIKTNTKNWEEMGLTDLLIPQRWWGTGEEIEGSSFDCLAMTTFLAAHTKTLNLITAIHPGFFSPATIAKWGTTMDRLTSGRWSINVTSGWHMEEFDMFGVDKLDHDTRYKRTAEFIEVIRGAWNNEAFDYAGDYYQNDNLRLEPRPVSNLEVFQGGQSDAAINLASQHSDWMFLNGGTPERIEEIVGKVSKACESTGRTVRFGMYAIPLCRDTDDEAWDVIDGMLARVDKSLVEKRKQRTSGAHGMWDSTDPLSAIDSNEGYAARLIGSPDTILERIELYKSIGIEMLHLGLGDEKFKERVFPKLEAL
ncbi:MAG: hypothetical protein CL718_06015 [Chloroflexi bacterium]|nr:hypothetical protein [Chloroflexota bacterium]